MDVSITSANRVTQAQEVLGAFTSSMLGALTFGNLASMVTILSRESGSSDIKHTFVETMEVSKYEGEE